MTTSPMQSPKPSVGGKIFPFEVVELLWLGCILAWAKWENLTKNIDQRLGRPCRISDLYDYGDELAERFGITKEELSVCRWVMDKLSLPFKPEIVSTDRWNDNDQEQLKKQLSQIRQGLEEAGHGCGSDYRKWAENFQAICKERHRIHCPPLPPVKPERLARPPEARLANRPIITTAPGNALKSADSKPIASKKPEPPKAITPTPPPSEPASVNLIAGKILNLPIASVTPSDYQPREEIDWNHVNEVAGSIREVGQNTPIKVREHRATDGSPAYKIIGGENRYWAIKEILKGTHIQAIVDNAPHSDQELFEIAFSDNVCRLNYAPMETARSIRKMFLWRTGRNMGKTEAATEIGKAAGLELRHVYSYDSLNELIPEAQALLSRKIPSHHRLPLTAAFKLATLTPDKQREILEKAKSKGRLRLTTIAKLVKEAIDGGHGRTNRNKKRLNRHKEASTIRERLDSYCGARLPDTAAILAQLTAEDIYKAAASGKSEAAPSEWLTNTDIAIRQLIQFREELRMVATGEWQPAMPLEPVA